MTYYYNLPGYGTFETTDPELFAQQLSQIDWMRVVLPALGIWLLVLGVVALFVVAYGRIFHKAGLPWERIFVPVYGEYWQYRLAGCSWIFWAEIILGVLFSAALICFHVLAASAVESLLPLALTVMLIAALIFQCIYCVKLSKSFGHGTGFGIGLLLLQPIFILILGYGQSEYVGEYK